MTATFLPVRCLGGSGSIQPSCPAAVNDGALDLLDGDRRIIDAEHARAFARRRTNAAGELGKIVGLVQPVQCLFPEAAVNKVIPLRDQIIDRAAAGHAADERAGVAEGDAAIHAARALLFQFGFRHVT